MLHLSKRRQQHALIASLILTLSIGIAPMALAKYRPPKNPSAPRATGANTTRGDSCDRKAEGKLTPLVPFSHIGQTSSQRPTFVWFVPDRTAHPLQFRLFTRTGQPLYRTEIQSQPGVMSVALPPDLPQLTIGQAYQWQVALICNPNVPSRNVVTTAEIQVVEPAASLQTQLATVQTPQQQSDLYAEAGLWYDAIATALKASETAQNQSTVLDLLDSLASSEAQPLKDWSNRLRQIEAIERQRQEPQPKP
ncbi:DUF928 domain-containing protein [Trichocoleus sp. FACHB-591]|uniref:DUF928 domain-containing protein n=1 Tax=Trichocoleus sp. FACHB-591 TaxID=2692872 RepID=UPI0016830F64|nr:DUF928 domain-containing protein [Trichocoleus sp. FACHB-591]MBD2095973.1 DUF928 domain-containing protein [Trichocoleus sp. FACHB-591]